jgi:hypothetical protein
MNCDPHNQVLDAYFWHFVDRGDAQTDTPLFTGVTDNLHVHVALCPRTARGTYVGCSTARTPASGHKDQMKYLRSCFEQENKRWARILASPQKLEEHFPSASTATRSYLLRV